MISDVFAKAQILRLEALPFFGALTPVGLEELGKALAESCQTEPQARAAVDSWLRESKTPPRRTSRGRWTPRRPPPRSR